MEELFGMSQNIVKTQDLLPETEEICPCPFFWECTDFNSNMEEMDL